jgi:uncharacterized protein (DUF1015 family)
MPDIAPIRGVLYDPARVDAAKVIAPPYDVIDAAERAKLAATDPHNVVRLILPEAEQGGDKYAAAAKTMDAWLASGVLKRDDYKALYRYHQVFTHPDLGDREVVRQGFIAAVRLHPFSDRVILPHERTLKGPKEDRLALMKATSSHFSQIFTLYRDAAGEVDRVFRKFERDAPLFEARTADGTLHRLWRVRDAESIGKIRHVMAPKKLYIADGHHRYETMLALREHLAGGKDLSTYSSAQYGTMFLCNMDQQGLVVLPTHRVLHSLQGFAKDAFLDKARAQFIVDKIDGGGKDPAAVRAALTQTEQHQPALAVAFPGEAHAWRLTLSPGVNIKTLGLGAPAVARLDVSLLHGVIFERLLGITPAAQEAQTNLRYIKDTAKALAETGAKDTQAVFLMSPVPVDQVTHVADVGECMPQKSTYFFPKIASGLVMNKIDPDEDLI